METRSQNEDVLTEPHPQSKTRLIASPNRALPAINASWWSASELSDSLPLIAALARQQA